MITSAIPGPDVDVGVASCRLCSAALPPTRLLTFTAAPRGAQAFVDERGLTEDRPIPLEIKECPSCGLVQALCEPVPNWRYVITASSYSQAMKEVRDRQIRHFVGSFDLQDARIIEAGCGTGAMLDLLAGAGLDVAGLEASPVAVAECRRRGHSAVVGYAADAPLVPGAPFEAFVSINVLEHAVDPRAYLRGARAMLSDGAVGMVEVPSFERMLDLRRTYDFVADHLSYFSRDSLSLVLELSGFEVVEISDDWWPDDLVAFVRVRQPVTMREAQADLEAVVAQVQEFFTREAGEGAEAAVWGASHQALTLLALVDTRHVTYVVDSAPFKQGLYTPASHLPVIAPDRVASDPPSAVLVMAAGYSDEVARTLVEDLGYSGVIGILRGDRVEIVSTLQGS